MPLPKGLAQFNRRATNRVSRRIAGWMPGFGIVVHTGRRSGKTFQTPVNAFRTPDGYRIALTYGADSDWVRNVLAAGGCELLARGRRVRLARPHLLTDPSNRWAPPIVRQILGLIGATQHLELTFATGAPGSSPPAGEGNSPAETESRGTDASLRSE